MRQVTLSATTPHCHDHVMTAIPDNLDKGPRPADYFVEVSLPQLVPYSIPPPYVCPDTWLFNYDHLAILYFYP